MLHCCSVRKIQLIYPGRAGVPTGNATTALRWARFMRQLDYDVKTAHTYDGEPCDVLVALHAYRSAGAVRQFKRRFPERAAVVAFAGTDLVNSQRCRRVILRSVQLADRIVVLQPLALEVLPRAARRKASVILQSAARPASPPRLRARTFDVAVVAHHRHVKDPLRAAMAARELPPTSRIHVRHIGVALSQAQAERARAEMLRNRRYTWCGQRSPAKTRQLLASSRALIVSSRLEGGANVVSEAIVAGVPVLASRIAGNVGLLGADYGGYFECGRTEELTRLLERFEIDARFRTRLQGQVRRLAPRFTPERERQAWGQVLKSLKGSGRGKV